MFCRRRVDVNKSCSGLVNYYQFCVVANFFSWLLMRVPVACFGLIIKNSVL